MLMLVLGASLLVLHQAAYAADAGGGGVKPAMMCMDCGTTAPPPAQPVTITRYVITDRLGNPVAKTNSVGAVIWRQTYTPYGETTQQPDPDGPGFAGHRHDAATGLVYMQARYYDPKIGRFLSPDPVTFSPDKPQFFNRYWYAQGNPYRYTDPDGRSATAFIGGLFVETWHAVTGQGFNGGNLVGALTDGYNGEGGGVVSAALQDATTLSVIAGGVGALKGAALLVRQTGEKIVSNLAKGAIKDDIKGTVRQIVKGGGEKQFRKDAASAMKGAKVKTVETKQGSVQVGAHSDGTTVSARSFSSSGRSTIQVKQPKTSITTKARYEKD